YDNTVITNAAKSLSSNLQSKNIRVLIDDEDGKTPGSKFFKWELKGVPVRIELGPKDIENNQVVVVDRIGLGKRFISLSTITDEVTSLLDTIQKSMFEKAQERQKSMHNISDNLSMFGPLLTEYGNFYQTSWCGLSQCETELK